MRLCFTSRLTAGVFVSAAAAACLVPAPAARAAFFINTTGLVAPTKVITFEEHVLAENTSVGSAYAAEGVTFSPDGIFNGVFYSPFGPEPGMAGQVGNDVGNVNRFAETKTNPFSFSFTQNASAVGFTLAADPLNTVTFTARLNGVDVESFTAPGSLDFDTSHTGTYYGFTGLTFNEVVIEVSNNGYALLDTLQFTSASTGPGTTPNPAAVPLPAGVWGGLAMLGGIGTRVRFRNKRKTA